MRKKYLFVMWTLAAASTFLLFSYRYSLTHNWIIQWYQTQRRPGKNNRQN